MGFLDVTRYLKVLFTLAPIGIIMLISGYSVLSRNSEKLPYEEGYVISVKTGYYYDNLTQKKVYGISIQMKNSLYQTPVQNFITIINTSIFKGDKIMIWSFEGKRKGEIAQIEKEGELIIPYAKSTGLGIGFLVLGAITSFVAIGYLIKYTEDIKGIR